MKRLYFLYILPLAWACMCCQDEADIREGGDICLNVAINDLEASSRAVVEADEFRGSAPTPGNTFAADVWFSNTPGEYLDNPQAPTYVPCHTKMTFDGSLVYAIYGTNNLKYTTQPEQPVYCVGFYPQDTWTTQDGKSVTATIDGTKDLMFAEEIEGTWSNPLKEQNYRHLLTWLKVCICATSQEAADAWGEIASISVNSCTEVAIDLENKTTAYGGDSKDFEAVGSESLHTTMREVGSIFCSPATAYTVKITFENGGQVEKTIPLMKFTDETQTTTTPLTDATEAVGKQFIMTLYFNPYDVVEGVCTLTAWNDQNEDLYLK